MMEQRCPLVNVWLAWLGLPILALVVGIRTGWLAAACVLAVSIAAQALFMAEFLAGTPAPASHV